MYWKLQEEEAKRESWDPGMYVVGRCQVALKYWLLHPSTVHYTCTVLHITPIHAYEFNLSSTLSFSVSLARNLSSEAIETTPQRRQ